MDLATRRQHDRASLRYETDLTDAEWAVVAPLMPEPASCGRPPVWTMREVLNAIVYVLRADPAFKLACGRLPESGADLMSQPTVSRMENTPGLRDLIRLGRVLVDLQCARYAMPPAAVTLDIDDTCDVVQERDRAYQVTAVFTIDSPCFDTSRRD